MAAVSGKLLPSGHPQIISLTSLGASGRVNVWCPGQILAGELSVEVCGFTGVSFGTCVCVCACQDSEGVEQLELCE
jgi:hypothetical protein